jgi:hypothetical protein
MTAFASLRASLVDALANFDRLAAGKHGREDAAQLLNDMIRDIEYAAAVTANVRTDEDGTVRYSNPNNGERDVL